jgi:hypothetical protein
MAWREFGLTSSTNICPEHTAQSDAAIAASRSLVAMWCLFKNFSGFGEAKATDVERCAYYGGNTT